MSAPEVPPWLSHLRRDKRGLPVPFVNLWGPEDVDRYTITQCPWAGMPGVVLDDSDQDEPDFTRQSMHRQRECMVGGLCQVCARPVPFSRRCLVIADMSVQRIVLQGREVLAVTEPWLCRRCALFAVERCPALIRRYRHEHLRVIPVTSAKQYTLTFSTGWLEGPLEEQTKAEPPVLWAKVLLH